MSGDERPQQILNHESRQTEFSLVYLKFYCNLSGLQFQLGGLEQIEYLSFKILVP